MEFDNDDALEWFRKAGQKVEGQTVFLDPEFVLQQVAKAPREFDVHARNPANTVRIGGGSMVFSAIYGPPFVHEGSVWRDDLLAGARHPGRLRGADDAVADLPGRRWMRRSMPNCMRMSSVAAPSSGTKALD
ncbi:hypothetical protein BH23ACT6_BH23ACT6_20900 [soil metagenome]